MRVLYVNDRIGFAGGAERNIYDAAVGLAARGHEADILYGSRCENGLERYSEAFGETFELPRDAAAAAGEIARIIVRRRPDVAYFHRLEKMEILLPLMTAVPSARMIHDLTPVCLRRHKYFPVGGRICRRPLGPWCVFPCLGFLERRDGLVPVGLKSYRRHVMQMRLNRLFSRIIVASTYMRDVLLLNRFDPRRVVTIPLSVGDMPREAAEVDAESNRILFIGAMIRSKGVDLFLRMLTRLKHDFHAVIVGEGRQMGMFRALCDKLGLSDRVEFTGWLPRAEVDEELRRSRLLVVSPRWPEPFNLVGIEAMANRRPVVGFAVGGIPDWLADGENGFLAGEQDLDLMAARVDELLGDVELCRRFGDTGLSMVKSRFGFDVYLDKLEAVLLEVGRIDGPVSSAKDVD